MTNHKKITLFLTGIFLAALIAIIIELTEQGRHEYAINIAVKACIWIIYTLLEVKYHIKLSHYIRTFVMVVILSDSFLGLYLNLYVTSSIFDKIQHGFGGYAFSLFAYNLICTLTQPIIGAAFRIVFVISLGLSIGASYEIGEFIGDLVAEPSVPSQPSLLDTNLDLIADMIGSIIAAVHLAATLKFTSHTK